MQAELRFHAKILVRKAGYRWSGGGLRASLVYKDTSEDEAEAGDDECDPQYFEVYNPFCSAPDLFMAFGDLEALARPSSRQRRENVDRVRDGILDFVDRYGVPELAGVFIESFSREIRYMRAAIELWEATRAHDQSVISKYVTWKRRDGWSFAATPIRDLLDGAMPVNWLQAADGDDQALSRAEEIVDMVIAVRCGEELRIQPLRRPGSSPELWIEIDNLLRVIWLQFALAVAGDKRYRRCEVCDGPFEVAPGTNRKDRTFCSDACRLMHTANVKPAHKHVRCR